MSTLAISHEGKLSLRNELESHGIPVMDPQEVRDIKRGMCDNTFFWLLSCIPGLVHVLLFCALQFSVILCMFGWGYLVLQAIAAAGVWLLNGPAYWGFWPTWAMVLYFGVVTLLACALRASFISAAKQNRFVAWFSQRFRGYLDEVVFDMPAAVLNDAFYVQQNLQDVKIDIVYEERDPFLRFRRGFEYVYSHHWDR